jgi:2-keto-4-pentenoate hydratase
MDDKRIKTAAQALRDTRLRRSRFPGFSSPDGPQSAADGYAIQRALCDLLVQEFGSIAGYKIGCTSAAMQSYMQIDTPAYGVMFAADEVPPGGDLRIERYVRPGFECEIGVRLGSDLDLQDGAIDRDRVAKAVAAAFVSIEIVDDRFVDYRGVGTPTLIADTFMNAGFVRGAERTDVDPLQLDRARARMIVNGRVAGEGSGRDVLGHPLDVLVWLANETSARGLPLRAGTIVTTGSMVVTHWTQRGDVVTMQNDMLGDVTVTVR